MLRTKSVHVLVKLEGANKNKELFTVALESAIVSVTGELKNPDDKETVKIMYLNSGNKLDQLAEIVKSLLPEYTGDLKIVAKPKYTGVCESLSHSGGGGSGQAPLSQRWSSE